MKQALVRPLWRLLFTLLVLCAGSSASAQRYIMANAPQGGNVEAVRSLEKFDQFYNYLNNSYVDTLNSNELIEEAIKSVLQKLDPHSSYISAEEMTQEEEIITGNFSGIGIEFNLYKDTVMVANVISGGPAEQVGLLPNDRIILADTVVLIGKKLNEVPKYLRGEKGSRVDLEVVRRGVSEPLHFTIIRDDIPLYTVDAAYKVNDSTGYIRINRFAQTTVREFWKAYIEMGEISSLILDLRSNGGGLLDQAIALSNFFLPQGALIVSTERLRAPAEQARAVAEGPFQEGKVVVLINETSASASEIVSGAIQDWDRGVIVGRRSFGKGLVQRQFPLLDGSATRITVAHYKTPSGRIIQRPYTQGHGEEYAEDFRKRFSKDSTATVEVDSTRLHHTLKLGRTVYGGGGITPDVVVEFDTTAYTTYWGNLLRKGQIIGWVTEYLDKNRTSLQSDYPTLEAFIEGFTLDEAFLETLQQRSIEAGYTPTEEEIERSAELILEQAKALIAQRIWGIGAFYEVINAAGDPVFDKAMEVLSSWEHYAPQAQNSPTASTQK